MIHLHQVDGLIEGLGAGDDVPSIHTEFDVVLSGGITEIPNDFLALNILTTPMAGVSVYSAVLISTRQCQIEVIVKGLKGEQMVAKLTRSILIIATEEHTNFITCQSGFPNANHIRPRLSFGPEIRLNTGYSGPFVVVYSFAREISSQVSLKHVQLWSITEVMAYSGACSSMRSSVLLEVWMVMSET